MEVNIENIIDFLDNSVNNENSKYSNAIVVLLGEELGAFCYKKYIEDTNENVEVIIENTIPCKGDGKKGRQLDCWILIKNFNAIETIYQVEIKTWNSNGIGSKPIPLDAKIEDLSDYGEKEWKKQWDV